MIAERQVDSRTIRFPMPASTAIAAGDLLWNNSGVAARASAQTDQGSEAANQTLFKSLFLGVSADQRLAGETDTTPTSDRTVVTDGVFDCTCPTGHTWVVGDLVAASEDAGGTFLENQQVEYTADASIAIGYCVRNGTSSDTTVRVRLISHYLPNTVDRSSLDASLADDTPLVLGDGSDAKLLWSTADASNNALVLALGDSNQALHITDVGAIATDWSIAATTDPNVYIHSNTTPATDYLRLGGHTGTTADIDVVGGTTLNLQIAGSTAFAMTATALTAVATAKFAGAGSTLAPLFPVAAQQDLSGAGAINITTFYTAVTTTGADALTLANGAQLGQLKKIQLIVDGGDGTLTPVSLSGGTTITFADAGDFAILMWNGTAWVAIELGNDADGATAPVLA